MTTMTIVPQRKARFETRRIHNLFTADIRCVLSKVVMNKDSSSQTALGSCCGKDVKMFNSATVPSANAAYRIAKPNFLQRDTSASLLSNCSP